MKPTARRLRHDILQWKIIAVGLLTVGFAEVMVIIFGNPKPPFYVLTFLTLVFAFASRIKMRRAEIDLDNHDYL